MCDIHDQIQDYVRNRDQYSKAEREFIRKSLRESLKELPGKVIRLIDKINQD